MRRAAILAALAAAAGCSRHPAPVPATGARTAFLAGVAAHMAGDDDAAERDWTLCLSQAAPGGEDELNCRLFGEMIAHDRVVRPARMGAEQAGDASARLDYLAGLAEYGKADYGGADQSWHACVSDAKPSTPEMTDCLTALELIKARRAHPVAAAPAAATSAQQRYLEGVIHFQKGDYEKARASWKKCARLAAPGSGDAADCRAGLERIAQLYGPASTAPDEKK